jgi:hypothetical protein
MSLTYSQLTTLGSVVNAGRITVVGLRGMGFPPSDLKPLEGLGLLTITGNNSNKFVSATLKGSNFVKLFIQKLKVTHNLKRLSTEDFYLYVSSTIPL